MRERCCPARDDVRDEVLVVAGRVVVLNRNRVLHEGRQVGTVTTLRDRTELLAMQSELSARESITETLRAQTHEFNNQLHTISGLDPARGVRRAVAVVGRVTRRRAEITEEVTARVDDPAIAALLIAKVSLAAERGVGLRLAEDAALPPAGPGPGRRRRHRARQPRRQRGRRAVSRRAARRSPSAGAWTATWCWCRWPTPAPACPEETAAAVPPRLLTKPATPAAGVSGWRWCRWSASVGAARVGAQRRAAPSSPPGCPVTEEPDDDAT